MSFEEWQRSYHRVGVSADEQRKAAFEAGRAEGRVDGLREAAEAASCVPTSVSCYPNSRYAAVADSTKEAIISNILAAFPAPLFGEERCGANWTTVTCGKQVAGTF